MPLVIAKSGVVQYVPSKEWLGEILGHSDFDGEDWAIGDRLVFEEGTESRIKPEPGGQFYVWDDPTPADFEEVKSATGVRGATNWSELFRTVEVKELRKKLSRATRALPKIFGCLATVCVLVLLCLGLMNRVSPWSLSAVLGLTVVAMAVYANDVRYYRAKLREAEERNMGGTG